jgi:hypothetical protein
MSRQETLEALRSDDDMVRRMAELLSGYHLVFNYSTGREELDAL